MARDDRPLLQSTLRRTAGGDVGAWLDGQPEVARALAAMLAATGAEPGPRVVLTIERDDMRAGRLLCRAETIWREGGRLPASAGDESENRQKKGDGQ